MRLGWLLAPLLAGCATVYRAPHELTPPGFTTFERVGLLDFRRNAPGGPNSLDDFRKQARPGDLLVVSMHPGRAVAKRQWLFLLLPCGHSLVVLDPHDPKGILECRFRGAKRVGPEELELYTHCEIFRLRDSRLLNLDRLHQFADESCQRTRAYNFRSWLGFNDCMTPFTPEDISPQYTCSTFVAAAFYFAGVRLSVTDQHSKVVTPQSLAASYASRVPIPTNR